MHLSMQKNLADNPSLLATHFVFHPIKCTLRYNQLPCSLSMTSSSGLGFSWIFALSTPDRPYWHSLCPLCWKIGNRRPSMSASGVLFPNNIAGQWKDDMWWERCCADWAASSVIARGHCIQDSAENTPLTSPVPTGRRPYLHFLPDMCSPTQCLLSPDVAHH